MGRRKNEVHPEALRAFARELDDRRTRAGLTQEELGQMMGWGRQSIGAVERCERPPTQAFAESADRALGAQGKLIEAFPRREGVQRRRYLDEYVNLERRAQSIEQFHPQVLPALLQHPDYARAEAASMVPPKTPEELDELLEIRLGRQQVFDRRPPLAAHFVIDEAALRRVVGGPEVMRRQAEHIISCTQNPFITVQILTFDNGPHPLIHGACTILGMTATESVLFTETTAGGQVLTDPGTVATAVRRFGALKAIARNPAQSIEYLRGLAWKDDR